MNRYQAKTKAAVAAYGADVVELELSPSEEADVLGSNVLELVPRTYRVLSDNYQVPQGETFDAVFLVEIEAALIGGGHIERVDDKPAKPDSEKSKPSKSKES